MGDGSVGLAIYDDRLEVTSTGPLHFGLTLDDLFGPYESRPWNPLIARTFYRRGIIEEWGGPGTIRMADLATSAGLPRPEIEERGDYVPPQLDDSKLTKQQMTILTLLQLFWGRRRTSGDCGKTSPFYWGWPGSTLETPVEHGVGSFWLIPAHSGPFRKPAGDVALQRAPTREERTLPTDLFTIRRSGREESNNGL